MNEKRPQPVVNNVGGWSAAGVIVTLLLSQLLPELGEDAIATIAQDVVILAPTIAGVIVGMLKARGLVTPVHDPVDNDGNPLVPSLEPDPVG